MKLVWSCLTAAASFLVASTASAHFVWIVAAADSSGQPAAEVYFSELAEPDSADLLDKIATTKAWGRTADGAAIPLELTRRVEGAGGAWVAPLKAEVKALSAAIKYGVLTRRDQTFLLNYEAKYLDLAAAESKALGRDRSLTLDVVPHPNAKGLTLEVLFRGKPVAGSEVVIFDPAAAETDAKTDEAGQVELAALKPGLYSIRAKWVVAEAGKEGDKEYPQINYYSTLSLRVPEKDAAAAASPLTPSLSPTRGEVSKQRDGATAADMIRESREKRAIWNDFPGFTADLVLFAEGREQTGRLTVAADGQVALDGFELKDEKSIVGALRSLVGHRMPGGESDNNVSFADEQRDHPLGRLIKLDYDSAMASAYRIKDGVIREVNRQMDGGRFTISVFEVHRNAEGKYLPGYYTVSFWNKDGSLRTSSVTHETWVRVGNFDLPATHASVRTANDEHSNVSMQFSNHKLGK